MTKPSTKSRRKPSPIGEVFYHGPSVIDGKPIVGLLSLRPSVNRKLGSWLLQTWILLRNVTPLKGQQTGRDKSICGECLFRPTLRREAREAGDEPTTTQPCYVTTYRAPGAVWRAWKAGRYSKSPQTIPRWAVLRAGSYGDPAAIPYDVWAKLIKRMPRRLNAQGRQLPVAVGYTQRWRTCDPRFKSFCMASVTTPMDALLAQVAGWRTYRSRRKEESLLPMEFACPASKEEGYRLTCENCMACYGSIPGRAKQPASPAIKEH